MRRLIDRYFREIRSKPNDSVEHDCYDGFRIDSYATSEEILRVEKGSLRLRIHWWLNVVNKCIKWVVVSEAWHRWHSSPSFQEQGEWNIQGDFWGGTEKSILASIPKHIFDSKTMKTTIDWHNTRARGWRHTVKYALFPPYHFIKIF